MTGEDRVVPRSRDEVALGIGRYLHPFALARNASAYWNWNRDGLSQTPTQSLRTFEQAFREAMQNARRIHFNLKGIRDVVLAADAGQRHGFVAGNLTNAELHAVRATPAWLQKCIFYIDDKPVPSPCP